MVLRGSHFKLTPMLGFLKKFFNAYRFILISIYPYKVLQEKSCFIYIRWLNLVKTEICAFLEVCFEIRRWMGLRTVKNKQTFFSPKFRVILGKCTFPALVVIFTIQNPGWWHQRYWSWAVISTVYRCFWSAYRWKVWPKLIWISKLGFKNIKC